MIDEFEYEDMPSNEQRLDYLDNPWRAFTPVKDFNYRVIWKRNYDEKQKTRAGLLQRGSQENEVSEQ